MEDCPLCCLLPPLQLCVPSTVLGPLYGPLSPLRPSVPSTALCPLYGPLFPLRPCILSKALCPLHSPLPPPRPSATSTALFPLYSFCSLYSPLSSLQPSTLSTTVCDSTVLKKNALLPWALWFFLTCGIREGISSYTHMLYYCRLLDGLPIMACLDKYEQRWHQRCCCK